MRIKYIRALKYLTSYKIMKNFHLLANSRVKPTRMDVGKDLEEETDISLYKNISDTVSAAYYIQMKAFDMELFDIINVTIDRIIKKNEEFDDIVKETILKLESWHRKGNYDRKIIDLQEYVKKNIGRRIKISEMAKRLNMSHEHFTRFFKRITGLAPVEYLTNIRIERAKEMLKEDYKSNIAQIAFKCGFSTPKHFSKIFKRKTGINPSQFKTIK